MCEKVVEKGPYLLYYVPQHLKMKEMCEKVVEAGLGSLKYVPDYFVTHQQIKMWRDDHKYCKDQKRKAQKASMKDPCGSTRPTSQSKNAYRKAQ